MNEGLNKDLNKNMNKDLNKDMNKDMNKGFDKGIGKQDLGKKDEFNLGKESKKMFSTILTKDDDQSTMKKEQLSGGPLKGR